jgi:hypothetical protein
VDISIPGNAKLFVDTFDGSVNNDPTAYGLNNSLRGRQPGVLSSGYTRISGSPDSTTVPAAWLTQVNHLSQPGKMSFWLGPSAVRLNKPVTAGMDGSYSVHAVFDPVVGDTASPDWMFMVLSKAANASAYPTSAASDLALTLRSDGRLQIYLKGKPWWASGTAYPPAADGSFDLTVTVFSAARLGLAINGAIGTVALPAGGPRTAYLSLGSYTTVGTEVSTLDDLRVSSLGGLGYYSARGIPGCAGRTDASIASVQSVYAALAAADPRIGYLMNFGWWLGGASFAEQNPLASLPKTEYAQQSIGNSVVGAG